jgi:hypothetical protein
LVDDRGADVDDVPTPLRQELGENDLGDMKEPGQVRPGYGVEVLLGVFEKRLADEEAGVVDECVHTPEALLGGDDDLLRGRALSDVAGDRQHLLVPGRGHRSRSGDHAVTPLAVAFDEPGSNAVRCARDDRDWLCAHGPIVNTARK